MVEVKYRSDIFKSMIETSSKSHNAVCTLAWGGLVLFLIESLFCNRFAEQTESVSPQLCTFPDVSQQDGEHVY